MDIAITVLVGWLLTTTFDGCYQDLFPDPGHSPLVSPRVPPTGSPCRTTAASGREQWEGGEEETSPETETS